MHPFWGRIFAPVACLVRPRPGGVRPRLGGVLPLLGGARPRLRGVLPRPGGVLPRQVIPLGGLWRSYPWALSGGHTPGQSLTVIPLGTVWRSYPWAASGGHTPVRKGGGPPVDRFPSTIPEDRANALSFVVCICPKNRYEFNTPKLVRACSVPF